MPRTGLITSVRRQSGKERLVWLYVDGQKLARLTAEDVASLGLRRGMELNEALLSEVMRRSALLEARSKAFRLLARRSRSRAEIRRYLKTKGFDQTTIETVLGQLERLGYVDDAAHSRAYAEQLVAQGRSGPRAVYAKLRQRGVAAEVAKAAVDDALSGMDQDAMAQRLAERRLRTLAALDVYTKRRRLYEYLARRGFDPDTISSVIARVVPADD
ncbi:MAG: RecX family transcriptional regulator [Armatimonadetes bacterium]|nr:RecX family transcriptional regulator [Armatimonadota bacterium]